MVLAMIPLMHASMARFFTLLFAPADAKGPPPVFVSVPPGLAVDLLIVAAISTTGARAAGLTRPTWSAARCCSPTSCVAVPISATPGWIAIAAWVQSLAG